MAVNVFANITQKGTEAAFHQAMELAEPIWDKHSMRVPSTAASETYVWPGFLPNPRKFLDGRSLIGIRDFTYTQTNETFELTFMIDRESMEDDQHGMVNMRISEAAGAWQGFFDYQFAQLLINGESGTLGIDTIDGSAFHLSNRTIGNSGTINNTGTNNITAPNAPLIAEQKAAIKAIINAMDRFLDDTGDRPFNAQARSQKRLVIPTEQMTITREVVNSSLTGGGNSNPYFENICEIDELLHLTDADNAMYMSYVGSARMPFIHQERTALEIIVDLDPAHVAKENGVLVMCRQRFRQGYGDPRRNFRYDYT